jgi:hypothetical protein
MEQLGGIVAESKIFLTYLEYRLFTPVSRQKQNSRNLSFDIDLSSLILQRRLSTSTYDSKISSITSSIFGCIRRPSDETMFSRFCFSVPALLSKLWCFGGGFGGAGE